MAFARKRGRKWYVSFLGASGRWEERASKARTKTEAERLGQDLERQAERQRLGLESIPTDTRETLGGLCSWWLDNRCPEASRPSQRYTLTAHIIDAKIGALPVRAVTAAVLEECFRDLEKGTKERKPLGPNSINKIRTTLRTVFSRARKAGRWNGNNPAADTEPRKVPRRVYETLTIDEVARLLRRLPRSWRGFFAAAAYAGLRKGECAGLRKADVDLERGDSDHSGELRPADHEGRARGRDPHPAAAPARCRGRFEDTRSVPVPHPRGKDAPGAPADGAHSVAGARSCRDRAGVHPRLPQL